LYLSPLEGKEARARAPRPPARRAGEEGLLLPFRKIRGAPPAPPNRRRPSRRGEGKSGGAPFAQKRDNAAKTTLPTKNNPCC